MIIDQSPGISDITFYIPPSQMDLGQLAAYRGKDNPELIRRYERAIASTGQHSIRFPGKHEDTATMAAEAARSLIERQGMENFANLRYLVAGTETTVDHSKPLSSYVLGMLQKAGYPLSDQLSSYQVQHACAAGTLALMGVSALLKAAGRKGETGLVLCSDIARYPVETSAEITQGAGAVALMVENQPKLLSLDLANTGYSSRDVDDFFRPLGSTTAKVKGGYSLKCYTQSLESAFLDHCRLQDEEPAKVLKDLDFMVLHAPYASLPLRAFTGLLKKYLGINQQEAEDYLQERGFQDSLKPVSRIGNIYTGSMYIPLAFLLQQQYKKWGDTLAGKKVLLCSYGSGNTMVVMQGQIQKSAPEIISRWDLDRILDEGKPASIKTYKEWIKHSSKDSHPTEDRGSVTAASAAGNPFVLSGIREDGYREYTLPSTGE